MININAKHFYYNLLMCLFIYFLNVCTLSYRVGCGSLFYLQIQSSDMILHVAVKHGLPKLHVGPHHVLLHTAVGKLSDASTKFLQHTHTHTRLETDA